MTIYRLNLGDPSIAEELWAMQHAAYRHEADLIGVPDLPPLQDTIESLQMCAETFYGYITEYGELAGAVSVEPEADDKIVICRMMVHPEFHRQGIATRLLQHIYSDLPSGSDFIVTAEARNFPAIRLYERNGFLLDETFNPAPNITMLRFVRRAV